MAAPTGDQLDVPVVLIVFNRPDKTRRVFAQIAHQRPRQLFVISDGPRDNRADDLELVHESRVITEQVDWPCEVTRLYSSVNLGCRARILSGLDYVFESVPKAIILEDDCLAHDDFFKFADELLSRFAKEPRVFSIGGHIWEYPDEFVDDGYFFSKYFSSWGWATWADRWRLVDSELRAWPSVRMTNFLRDWAESPMENVYWEKVFELVFRHESPFDEAWDYAVQFTMWMHDLLAVRPSVNLVQNLGFDESATHTRMASVTISDRVARNLEWPINHPQVVTRNHEVDALVNEIRIGGAFRNHLKSRS